MSQARRSSSRARCERRGPLVGPIRLSGEETRCVSSPGAAPPRHLVLGSTVRFPLMAALVAAPVIAVGRNHAARELYPRRNAVPRARQRQPIPDVEDLPAGALGTCPALRLSRPPTLPNLMHRFPG